MSDIGLTLIEAEEHFNCARRLYNPNETPEWNALMYGELANPNAYGYNYEVYAHVTGPVDSRTGFIYPKDVLKTDLKAITGELDHKNLNLDVPHFRAVIPTGENVVRYLFSKLDARIQAQSQTAQLIRLRLVQPPRMVFIQERAYRTD